MKKKKEIDVRNLYICNKAYICKEEDCNHIIPHSLEHFDYIKIPTCEYEDFCGEVDEKVKCVKIPFIGDFFIEDEDMKLS